MMTAAEAMGLAGIRVLEHPDIAEAALKELHEETNGVYVCPIPGEIGPRLED